MVFTRLLCDALSHVKIRALRFSLIIKPLLLEKKLNNVNGDLSLQEISTLMKMYGLFVLVLKKSDNDQVSYFNKDRVLVKSDYLCILVDKHTNRIYDYVNGFYNLKFSEWITRTHLEYRNDVSKLLYSKCYKVAELNNYFK